ncbi:MAG: esterase family protein [Bacteroidia bacterium]|nr:esterase family protein [Bacteroidia bacterium]
MSAFFTIGISDPEFEFDHLRWITVKSKALGRRADITIYVPPNAQPYASLDMVILLHGVYSSHWAWALKGGVHKTASRLIENGKMRPMVLVMPSDGLYGDGSGYLQHKTEDYEKWILDEVVAAVQANVPIVNQKSKIFITGLSMGGYGALRLGAKYPNVFSSFSGLSSITEFAQMALFLEGNDDTVLRNSVLSKESVLECLLANKERLPFFRFDCGTEDLLIAFNRGLHKSLNEHGIKHSYSEYPGGHQWEYWKKNVEDSLLFFNGF